MKPNVAKAKGRETENLYVDYLIEHGVIHAERRRLNGSYDQGDVTGWPGMCVEIKSGAKLDVQQWLRELDVEIENSKSDMGYVAVRPKGKPRPEDWFAVMPMELYMELLKQAGWLP